MENEQLASETAVGAIYQPWIEPERHKLLPQTCIALRWGANYKPGSTVAGVNKTSLLAGMQEPSQMVRLVEVWRAVEWMSCQAMSSLHSSPGKLLPYTLRSASVRVAFTLRLLIFLTWKHPGL